MLGARHHHRKKPWRKLVLWLQILGVLALMLLVVAGASFALALTLQFIAAGASK